MYIYSELQSKKFESILGLWIDVLNVFNILQALGPNSIIIMEP